MPTVSIVIPTYNQGAFLSETLASIDRQSYTDYELIVIDDGSTDDTADILRQYPKPLTYVYQPNSGGCSEPRNRGIALAKGRYVAIFDSDDLMTPTKLQRQVAVLEANPSVDFVFTDFVNFRGSEFFAPHTHTCTRFRTLLTCPSAEGAYILSPGPAFSTLIEENYIGASSIFFRKRLVDKIGLFDVSLKSSEDLDMYFRVTRDHRLAFIDEVGHFRRLHDTSMTKNFLKMHANMLQMYGKHLAATNDADTRRAFRRRIAEVYRGAAYYHRSAGDLSAALEAYRSSAQCWPTHWRTYGGALKTLGMRLRAL